MRISIEDAAGSVAFTAAREALGHSAPLEHRARFPVLGVPIEVSSNSPAVIEAAERYFGPWRRLEPDLVEPLPPRQVRVVVHPAGPPASGRAGGQRGGAPRHASFVRRVHSGCYLAASGSNVLMAQMDRGEALGFVTPELVADDA